MAQYSTIMSEMAGLQSALRKGSTSDLREQVELAEAALEKEYPL